MALVDVHPAAGGGRTGARLDLEDARLSPLYLTVSADMYRRMGRPKEVRIQVDPERAEIHVSPAKNGTGYVFGHHANRPSGRYRLSIKRALDVAGITDVPKRGVPIRAAVSADGKTIFQVEK